MPEHRVGYGEQQMKMRRRAFALILVLGMLTVLTMMVGALFASVLGPATQNRTLTRKVSGLYVAEAGLQHAIHELQNSPGWTTGFSKQLTPGGTGTYTVRFVTSGPYTAWDSVNNLSGAAAVDSHRGVGSVPKGCALVVVQAEVDGAIHRVEALVGQGAQTPSNTAMLAGGQIALNGDVKINGIKSFADDTSVAADVHSNDASAVADLIKWVGSSATIQGSVSTVGADPGAIDLGSASVSGTQQVGAGARQLPGFNIVSTIASKSGSPAPTINPTGPTVLPSGDYYHSGDLTVNGDLNLQDAKLYVTGKVVINGGVSGKGSLYVGSTTKLQGDANIVAQESQSLALLSQGDVTLDGFDGNAYFNSIASTDSAFASLWSEARTTVQDLQTDLQGSPLSTWDHTRMVNYLHVLGPFSVTPTHNGFQTDVTGKMAATLNAQAPSPTRDFLVKRLNSIAHLFKGGGSHYGGDANAISKFYATGDVGALFDATIDLQEAGTWGAVKNVINTINYDRLGSSYFQGVIYSNGNITANNDLTIVGALYAKGKLTLNNGVILTYVQSLFESGGVMSNLGTLSTISWLGP
jgi:hypothetical protein